MAARNTRHEGRRWTPQRLVIPGLLLAAGYWAVFGGDYSIFDVRSVRAAAVEEQIRLTEVQQRIDSLAAWKDLLENDPVTIERVAREEFGMIRDGETLYRFADVDPNRTPPAPTR